MFEQLRSVRIALLGVLLGAAFQLAAQEPPVGTTAPPAGGRGAAGRGARGGAGGGGGGGGGAYPSRPPADPAVLARGKTLWEANCTSCHAADLRGSNRGINLVRSKMVLDDENGEVIGQFLSDPHAAGGAPKMTWAPDQLKDVATFMHSFQNYRTIMAPVPMSAILVGDAAAGQTYFKAKCASCHSIDGSPSKAASLQGIGARIPSPKTLQNAFVSGSGGGGRGGRGGRGAPEAAPTEDGAPPPSSRVVTATLTWPNGRKVDGTLVSKDDFLVILRDADGQHSYRRDGDVPAVELHDPMKPHRDLLTVYTNKDIHDLTAYLVTLK